MHANNFKHFRVKKKKVLSAATWEKRLQFARLHVSWTQPTWDLVVFSDESKFGLCGNDSHVSIWAEKRDKPEIELPKYSKQGLMVWGAISSFGTLELVCVEETINAKVYVDMLEQDFFSKWENDLPQNFIFMQDNAPPHSAHYTCAYLSEKKVKVLEWPPYSPDLNPIENVWAIMSNHIYCQGKTYKNTNELWEALVKAWEAIDLQTIWNLYNSMTNRMCMCLEMQGRRIKY